MSSISKHRPKKRTRTVNPHYFCHYSFPGPDLEILNYLCFLSVFEGLVYVLIAQALRWMMNTSSLLNIHHDIDLEKKYTW